MNQFIKKGFTSMKDMNKLYRQTILILILRIVLGT